MKYALHGNPLISVALPLCVLFTASAITTAHSADPQSPVQIDDAGTVHTPPLEIPLSSYMSDQAKQAFIQAAQQSVDTDVPIAKLRALHDTYVQPWVDRAKVLYPVDIAERNFGGVRTRMITPTSGVLSANRNRVLINVHGGGFYTGAGGEALVESIPVAGLGKFKVVTVDYRQGPEYKFPAASEDTAAVYRELLKQYRPSNIGIYGCSAGGALTAMAVAWFQKHELPAPGAIGILGSGAFGRSGGDSRFTGPPLVGEAPLPIDPKQRPVERDYVSAYLSQADLSDPLISPALWPDVLARFPPTLLISGTRAHDMSAAAQTQRVLTKAGVPADLHLWDGMGHCFFFDADLPESQEAIVVITKFFGSRLGQAALR